MTRLLALLLAPAVIAGCGDARYQWTAEVLDAELDRVADTLPFCAAVPRGQPAARQAPSRRRSEGPCGGSVEGSSVHEDGNTDYDVLLDGFCVQGDQGTLVLDGAVVAREVGTPSDAGPVVEALELDTDGPLLLIEGGDTAEWQISNFRVVYGMPQPGSPGVPDAENPDRISVGEFTATFADGTVSYMRGLELTRSGPYTGATLEIVDGITGTVGEGRADLRTPEGDPLTFDIGSLGFTGGAVDYAGKGSTVTAVPSPTQPGVVDLELDGTPHERSLDCSAGVAPLLDVGFALLVELPVY